jgi:hypothetical protein
LPSRLSAGNRRVIITYGDIQVDIETFWTRVSEYNEATLPVQAIMSVVAAVLTYRVSAKPGSKTDVWMKAFDLETS